jgi:threonine dehydrogenase-like Zn-dependent dehydrogenase
MMREMKALVKNGSSLAVTAKEMPPVLENNDVIIRVAVAGICRTDVFAADGRIKTIDPVILGHEFSGIVEKTGDEAQSFKSGDKVTVMPVLPCGICKWCSAGQGSLCQRTTMLGIDHDGCFGEFIRVPAKSVYRLPAAMPFRYGAYVEPVAAAMSVLRAGLSPKEKGVVYGNNRFGQLISRILYAKGFSDITLHDPAGKEKLEENAFDFAVETIATTEAIDNLMKAVRPQGKIVIKSRRPEAVGIHFADAVRKEITFSAVNYGSFKETIDLMASGKLPLDDLLGEVHPLKDFSAVFERSRTHEERKTFFGLMDKDVWHC